MSTKGMSQHGRAAVGRGAGVCCNICVIYLSSLVKNRQKYTHLSILPTDVPYSSEQPSLVPRKCLQLGQSNAKGNNQTKELSSFNTVEREESHFGVPECFAIIFIKDQAILKFPVF